MNRDLLFHEKRPTNRRLLPVFAARRFERSAPGPQEHKGLPVVGVTEFNRQVLPLPMQLADLIGELLILWNTLSRAGKTVRHKHFVKWY